MFFKKLLSSLFISPFVFIILLFPILFFNNSKNNKKIKFYLLFVFFVIYFFSIDFGKNLVFYYLEKDYINYNVKNYIYNQENNGNLKNKKIDLVVILAAGGDYKYQLSEDSYDRLILGYLVYKVYGCDIFLSGGAISNNPNLKIPVSQIMKFYLLNFGVNPNKIFVDTKSLDTFQNIKNLQKFLDNKKYQNVLIITSSYHIIRTKLLLKYLLKNYEKTKLNFYFQGCSVKYTKYYDIYSFIPSFYNLYLSFVGIKEYFEILYYYIYFNCFVKIFRIDDKSK